MATKNITGLNDESIIVSTSGNTYNVAQNAKVIATGGMSGGDPTGAIMEDSTAMPAPKNNIYNIDGRVIGFSAGIVTLGKNDEVHIGETGKVSGMHGVLMTGNNSLFTNEGEIVAGQGYGVFGGEGTKMEFHNDGSIVGLAGMVAISSDKMLMVNEDKGDIVALQYGAALISDTGQTSKFINHGSVLVSVNEGASFMGGAGNETVINDGKMTGNVILNDGNDSFDNRGGVVQGTIAGGNGDDVLITDKASVKLYENSSEGTDTVKSTVNYTLSENVENLILLGNADINGMGNAGDNTLHGNVGNNVLKGLAGADVLFGGKGDDQLIGGADADIFHFVKGDGHDTITDFLQGTDKVDVSEWTGMNSLADIKSHAHNDGSNVVIEFGADSLQIDNIHKADLAMADFVFPI